MSMGSSTAARLGEARKTVSQTHRVSCIRPVLRRCHTGRVSPPRRWHLFPTSSRERRQRAVKTPPTVPSATHGGITWAGRPLSSGPPPGGPPGTRAADSGSRVETRSSSVAGPSPLWVRTVRHSARASWPTSAGKLREVGSIRDALGLPPKDMKRREWLRRCAVRTPAARLQRLVPVAAACTALQAAADSNAAYHTTPRAVAQDPRRGWCTQHSLGRGEVVPSESSALPGRWARAGRPHGSSPNSRSLLRASSRLSTDARPGP